MVSFANTDTLKWIQWTNLQVGYIYLNTFETYVWFIDFSSLIFIETSK